MAKKYVIHRRRVSTMLRKWMVPERADEGHYSWHDRISIASWLVICHALRYQLSNARFCKHLLF